MDPDVKVSGMYGEYFLQLRKRLAYLHKLLQDISDEETGVNQQR